MLAGHFWKISGIYEPHICHVIIGLVIRRGYYPHGVLMSVSVLLNVLSHSIIL